MEIRRIALNGWRNYDFASAEFSPGTNVISGENAQGKTNLLEAVYMLTGGRSFRTRFDKELIGLTFPPERSWRTSLRMGVSRP